ncbi:hypothetical protein FRC01_012243, partial [Tulasnella sp. 417]
DNILIDKYGRPRIIDFGLSKFVQEEQLSSTTTSSSSPGAGNYRFGPPELFLDPVPPPSSQMDMFSWASVAFFIFTGDEPFKDIIAPPKLVIRRSKGATPIPHGVTYPVLDSIVALKAVLLSCWMIQPEERPNIGKVVTDLGPSRHYSEHPLNTFTVAEPEAGSTRSSTSSLSNEELPGEPSQDTVTAQHNTKPDLIAHNPDLRENASHQERQERPYVEANIPGSQLPENGDPASGPQVHYITLSSAPRHGKESGSTGTR